MSWLSPEWVTALGNVSIGVLLLIAVIVFFWKGLPTILRTWRDQRLEVHKLTIAAIEQLIKGQEKQTTALEKQSDSIGKLAEAARAEKTMTLDHLNEISLSITTVQTEFTRRLARLDDTLDSFAERLVGNEQQLTTICDLIGEKIKEAANDS